MSKAIAEIAIGAGVIAIDLLTLGAATPLAVALLTAGASLVMGGVGTLLTKQMQGLSANVRNPIQPWNVVYGQSRVGGTVVFLLETGESDKYLHTVYVLACHPCQSVDAILFDDKRIPLDTSGNSISFGDSTEVIGEQQTVNIASITRAGDVVTVVMSGPMPIFAGSAAGPALATGDTIQIQNVTTDPTLNGQFQINLLSDTTFNYISGGSAVSITGQGEAATTWPDYGDTVHAEIALGTQTSNPFPGLAAGDDTGSNGIWTSAHALTGRTAVYLRLKYGGDTYASGLPSISFVVSGKADIFDPRTGGAGYTTNSALIIGDYLTQPVWGFKASYGTDVPYGALLAAANICDEAVTLASGGAEPRYTCNGSFQLSAKRGEILQNLLTSCGGRLTYTGGQFAINPAAWTGATVLMGTAFPTNEEGSPLVAANLVVWASWTPDETGYGIPVIDGAFGPPRITSIDLSSSFGLDTSSLSGSPSAISSAVSTTNLGQIFQLNLVAFIEGTTGGADTTPHVSTLNIYDCYIEASFEDGSSEVVRPISARVRTGNGSGIFYTGVQGEVANPGSAIDSDSTPPSTFASITREYYGSLADAGYLQLSSFSFPVDNSVNPIALTPLEIAAGPFQWKPKVASRELFNGVKATYISPANNWQSSDMPPYAQDELHGYESDVNLAADGGERRWYDIQLPFTNSTAMAQRLSKIQLLRLRQQGTGTFLFNLAVYQFTALDVLAMTLPFLGWTGKLLEVTAHRFTVNRQEGDNSSAPGMVLGTEIDVQETDPSIYDWAPSEELSAQGYSQALLGPSTVSAPTGATATSGSAVAADVGGMQQSRVQITWTAPTDGYVVNGGYTVVQYQITGSDTWTALGNYDSSTTSAYINGVSDGTSYTVRLAYMSAQGIQSRWTVLDPVVASGSTGLNFVENETPAGTMDGVNPVFTLAYLPLGPIALYYDGVLQLLNIDYSLFGSIITFLRSTNLPNDAYGEWLRAWYRRA